MMVVVDGKQHGLASLYIVLHRHKVVTRSNRVQGDYQG